MTVKTNNDKHILEGLKGRLKQRQEQDKERAEHAAAEQRKRERLREERELRDMREREQRETEARMKEEQEREEHEREERERIKERERNRRRHRSTSESPDRFRRSRSRSTERRTIRKPDRFQERNYRKGDHDKYKQKRGYEEVYESHFEKQAAESAKSSKEKKTSTSSNRKLPFIGRMPLFKKKNNEDEKEIKKEEYDIRHTKFEAVNSVKAFIPAPGVVTIMKLATPQDSRQIIKINAENPPPPPKIIPEPPMISENNEEEEEDEEEAPPPPNITEEANEEEEEIQAPPPMPEPDTKAKGGNHLPRDFQDALNIIYPGDQRPNMAMAQDPNVMMQYQYGMGYGMMYPGMQMYDYTAQDQVMSDDTVPVLPPAANDKPPPPTTSNDDDLAMLGIDAGDMAAQTM